jgi:hypothetical protein
MTWAHRASGSYGDGIDCGSFTGDAPRSRESRERDQRFAVVSAGRVVSQKSEPSSYAGLVPMEGALVFEAADIHVSVGKKALVTKTVSLKRK